MRKGYTIENSSFYSNNRFFYLFNYNAVNLIRYFGFSKSKSKYKHLENCIGVWKIKKLK